MISISLTVSSSGIMSLWVLPGSQALHNLHRLVFITVFDKGHLEMNGIGSFRIDGRLLCAPEVGNVNISFGTVNISVITAFGAQSGGKNRNRIVGIFEEDRGLVIPLVWPILATE